MPLPPRNLTPSEALLRREHRENLLRQRGCIVWMTGLSGAGKSTIARELERRLVLDSRFAYVLDGDNVRHRLNRDLGFSGADRHENIRRVAEVAQLFADAGAITIVAFISPYREDRATARELAGDRPFLEVHIATSLTECERRDPKGLYRKARAGEIRGFTGIDDPYETPDTPELRLDTAGRDIAGCAEDIIAAMRLRHLWGALPEEGGSGI
ncbi:MAG TPA: adenylyl-sulfate kinase [Planctomycetes bacterium]|nr:adenylyl-sulfate kinase [Planctomycetota bacterium]